MVTLKEAIEIIDGCFANEKEFCVIKNFTKFKGRANTIRFTVNILSLDALFAIMELDEVRQVFFHPSMPPPSSHVDPIALRYRVYIEFHEET